MTRKILGSVLAIMAVLALTAGTFASFTNQEQSTLTATTGTVDLSFVNPAQVAIALPNIQPGYAKTETIDLRNAGTLPGTLAVSVSTGPGSDATLASALVVQVAGQAAGANLPIGSMSSGATQSVPVAVSLPANVANPNDLQGKSASLVLTFVLTQAQDGIVVNGPTQHGWSMNAQAPWTAPMQFATAPDGRGALSVGPIPGAPADAAKFIAAYSMNNTPVANLTSLAFDYFPISAGTNGQTGEHFYFNVYTRRPGSTTWYDCRYDFAGATGAALGQWHTVTATPSTVLDGWQVTKNSSAPGTCPTSLGALESQFPGSVITHFTVNLGHTTATDAGLAGFLDNVVINTGGNPLIYNFEPTAP
jgi:spore coat-associated protein N